MGIQPIRKVVAPEIPDKLYFRIGDVARLCEVPAYVLRFWETEFPQLKPTKGGTGQRLYRRRDVEMALRIKSLLYDQRYTIPGARQVFKDEAKARETAAAEAFTPVPVPGESFAEEIAAPNGAARSEAGNKISSMARKSQVADSPAPENAPVSTATGTLDARRAAQLSALRHEMRGLLSLLEARPGQSASLAEARLMRPRLVLEPRPLTPRVEPLRPELLRLVPDLNRDGSRAPQGDLFPGE